MKFVSDVFNVEIDYTFTKSNSIYNRFLLHVSHQFFQIPTEYRISTNLVRRGEMYSESRV